MRYLIAAGADVNFQRWKWGETALIDSAVAGKMEAVKLLLANGALVIPKEDVKDHDDAVGVAEKNGHKAIANLLRAALKKQQRVGKSRVKSRGNSPVPAVPEEGLHHD
jgi:ankyrin repeat protein